MRKTKLEELGRKSLEEFKASSKSELVLVADNIRSGMNVGSLFRTADAFALQHLYLCGISAVPPHKEINKTAIGASQSVEWSHFGEVRDCIQELKKEGYTIVGIEQTTESIELQDFKIAEKTKYALILGNEVKGLSDEILDMIDIALEIPQFGTKHSLNVAVCAGAVIWEFWRQKFHKD